MNSLDRIYAALSPVSVNILIFTASVVCTLIFISRIRKIRELAKIPLGAYALLVAIWLLAAPSVVEVVSVLFSAGTLPHDAPG